MFYFIKLVDGNCGTIASGRIYKIQGSDYDYGNLYKTFPSRHFTIVYNTFVMLQIFNFLNARKIFDEINIFDKFFSNPLFLLIVLMILFFQFIIVSFTGIAFNMYTASGIGGLNVQQWFICIGFGAIALPWSIMTRLIPDRWFMEVFYNYERLDPNKVILLILLQEC